MELRAQRPFTKGVSFLVGYAWNHERMQQWFDDLGAVPGAAERRRRGLGMAADRFADAPHHRGASAPRCRSAAARRSGRTCRPRSTRCVGGWQYTVDRA